MRSNENRYAKTVHGITAGIMNGKWEIRHRYLVHAVEDIK